MSRYQDQKEEQMFKRRRTTEEALTFSFNTDGISFLKDKDMARAEKIIGPLTRLHEFHGPGNEDVRVEKIYGEEDKLANTASICVKVTPAYTVDMGVLNSHVPWNNEGAQLSISFGYASNKTWLTFSMILADIQKK